MKPDAPAARLAELPDGQLTSASVARFCEKYTHGEHEFARLDELGGLHVSGPRTCTCLLRDRAFGDVNPRAVKTPE